MLASFGQLITFHNNNKVLAKNCCIATVVSQQVCHLDRHLGVFKKFILRKIAANYFEINRKRMFTIKNRVEKRN